MNETKRYFYCVLAGFFFAIIVGGTIFTFTGQFKTFRLLNQTKRELQSAYRAIEQALRIAEGTVKTIDDLKRIFIEERDAYNRLGVINSGLRDRVKELGSIIETERAAIASASSANSEIDNAISELREIAINGKLDLDRLIQWAVENNL